MSDSRWSDVLGDDIKEWTIQTGNLAADALVDAKFIRPEDYEQAARIIEEEIAVRLIGMRGIPLHGEWGLPTTDA